MVDPFSVVLVGIGGAHVLAPKIAEALFLGIVGGIGGEIGKDLYRSRGRWRSADDAERWFRGLTPGQKMRVVGAYLSS